jgi:hypothetical protein
MTLDLVLLLLFHEMKSKIYITGNYTKKYIVLKNIYSSRRAMK